MPFLNRYRDLFIGVEAEGGHSDEELNIQISSTLNEDAKNESWGVRDFFLFYTSCAKACAECSGPTEKDCLSKLIKYFTLNLYRMPR